LFTIGQVVQEPGAAAAESPSPSPSSEGPKQEPSRTSDKGTIFSQNETSRDAIKPSSGRSDVSWEHLWLKSSVAGTHYNLNQKAKPQDSDATTWSRIFHEPAPFRDLDGLYFCGPESTMEIRIADSRDWTLVYVGTIEQVQPC
jgi:hypothetical protein